MTARPTSLTAFDRVKSTLGQRQRFALSMVQKHPNSTARELERLAGDTSLHKRLPELAARKFIATESERTCKVTGFAAVTWRVCDLIDAMVPPKKRPPKRGALLKILSRLTVAAEQLLESPHVCKAEFLAPKTVALQNAIDDAKAARA